jgi:hypothetical protein
VVDRDVIFCDDQEYLVPDSQVLYHRPSSKWCCTWGGLMRCLYSMSLPVSSFRIALRMSGGKFLDAVCWAVKVGLWS